MTPQQQRSQRREQARMALINDRNERKLRRSREQAEALLGRRPLPALRGGKPSRKGGKGAGGAALELTSVSKYLLTCQVSTTPGAAADKFYAPEGRKVRVAYVPDPHALMHWDGYEKKMAQMRRALEKDGRFEFTVVPAAHVRYRNALAEGNYNVVCLPGGAAAHYLRALGDGRDPVGEQDGKHRIEEFVRKGGGFVGICAGAYCGSSWGFGLLDVELPCMASEQWMRGMHPTCPLVFTAKARETLGADHWGDAQCRYNNGPMMRAGPGVEVLASFGDVELRGKHDAFEPCMRGSPAIVAGRCGEGRVVLTSPHAEDGMAAVLRQLFRLAAGLLDEHAETIAQAARAMGSSTSTTGCGMSPPGSGSSRGKGVGRGRGKGRGKGACTQGTNDKAGDGSDGSGHGSAGAGAGAACRGTASADAQPSGGGARPTPSNEEVSGTGRVRHERVHRHRQQRVRQTARSRFASWDHDQNREAARPRAASFGTCASPMTTSGSSRARSSIVASRPLLRLRQRLAGPAVTKRTSTSAWRPYF